jgi:hypothetical protein
MFAKRRSPRDKSHCLCPLNVETMPARYLNCLVATHFGLRDAVNAHDLAFVALSASSPVCEDFSPV